MFPPKGSSTHNPQCWSRVCRSDCESEEDEAEPRKPVPEWARGATLRDQLAAQLTVDPDDIFQQHKKTCALNEVFGHAGAPCCQSTPCTLSYIFASLLCAV